MNTENTQNKPSLDAIFGSSISAIQKNNPQSGKPSLDDIFLDRLPEATKREINSNESSLKKNVKGLGQDISQRGQNIADIQQAREQGKSATMEALKIVSPELASKVEPALSVAQKIKSKLGVGIVNESMGLDVAKAGQVAGVVNDILGRALMSIPGVEKGISLIGKEIGKVVPDVLAKVGVNTIEEYNAFAEQNPMIAKNLEGAVNIASLLPTEKVVSIGSEAISKGVKQVGKTISTTTGNVAEQVGKVGTKAKGIVSNVIPTSEQTILDIITPELSAKKTGQAIKAGRGKVESGTIFDTVSITPDSKVNKAFEATKDIIKPDATITENINIVRDALGTEAEALKNSIKDVPTIFTFKELNSALNKIDLPISFKEDAQAKVLKKVTDAAMKISKDQKGKLGGLLDARKEFDRLVEENFPNLYEAGKPTPTYNAITKTRNALNDFIESKLPEGFGYKESLKKQTSFYDALDAMESKAVKEVGSPTNKYIRKAKQVMKQNPRATNIAKLTAGGLTAFGVGKSLLGD